MIRSMTAFARSGARTEWGELTWEIRSVNHRYLEMNFRLPEELRALEPACRKAVAAHLRRGKVDGMLRIDFSDASASAIEINETLLDSLLLRVGQLRTRVGVSKEVDPVSVLRWPGVVAEAERDLEPVEQAAIAVIETCLGELDAARRAEGERLAEMILQRCDGIEEKVTAVRARLPEVRARLREKLMTRLAEFQVEGDPERIEQELVFVAQKMDVDEELDRLESHVAEIRDVLGRREPVGRRLDFLMQECNREANTLASKSNDPETTAAAVDIKVFVEQLREQVQNVE